MHRPNWSKPMQNLALIQWLFCNFLSLKFNSFLSWLIKEPSCNMPLQNYYLFEWPYCNLISLFNYSPANKYGLIRSIILGNLYLVESPLSIFLSLFICAHFYLKNELNKKKAQMYSSFFQLLFGNSRSLFNYSPTNKYVLSWNMLLENCHWF
jgi:hypothetical protein